MELQLFPSKLLKCRVCGSFPAQFHFGAVTCRSCAAFFRRFVNSTKAFVQCTCNQQNRSSYACRLCRMKKCLAVGMNKCLVQPPREKNRTIGRMNREGRITINHLVLRAFDLVKKIKQNYDFVGNDRDIMKTTSIEPGDINYFELSCLLRDDFFLLSNMIVKVFPEINQLSASEKDVLFTNFYPKWCVFEGTIMEIKHSCLSTWYHETASGEVVFSLEKFYCNKDGTPVGFTPEQLSAIFTPYWKYMMIYFKKLISDIGFDEIEEMCVLALLFFDTGYSNLSTRSIELCENIRKCVYRELKAYCLDKEENELRFFEVLNVLPLIEKGEEKSYEELQLCSLYKISADEDFFTIMSASKS